jgi:hypothetical protein
MCVAVLRQNYSTLHTSISKELRPRPPPKKTPSGSYLTESTLGLHRKYL